MFFNSFNVLYVEDENTPWERLEKAILEHNKEKPAEPINVVRARAPEEVKEKLDLNIDLVLADVYLPRDGKLDDRLDDIIEYVESWSSRNNAGRPLPIIAFTGWGEDALKNCLIRREKLFDIWDKSSASPPYVAWRLSEFSKELSRIRPDMRMQQLIRGMPPETGSSWHQYVIEMTQKYDSGWTEYDQIRKAGEAIQDIADSMDVWPQCEPMWESMTEWEGLSRASSRKIRGHARHVINVFWLGYYLLHHEYLRDFFSGCWEGMVSNRPKMEPVRDVRDPLEALSNCWYYAGLFHDVGGCIEKSYEVVKALKRTTSLFGDLAPDVALKDSSTRVPLIDRATRWLNEFDDDLSNLIRPVVIDSDKQNKPDQGVVAALLLRAQFEKRAQGIRDEQGCYAREGARAMSMHNLFPQLAPERPTLPVSWEDDPLVCLLLLCDQLQTWHRERSDETSTLAEGDFPSRAELADLEVRKSVSGRPKIYMSIDYIAPQHLAHTPDIYERVKSQLTKVLREYPFRALKRIKRPWPFGLEVQCTLSKDPLTAFMKLE
jgi:CheY-like chemotaxis protein